MNPELRIFPDEERVAEAVVDAFSRVAREAVEARGAARIVITGGSTPRAIYARLGREPYRGAVPWDRIHLFWGDERSVPPGHPRSNYGMVERVLLRHVSIPPGNVHRMRGEWEPQRAAHAYAEEIRAHFGATPLCWDLVHLGLGENMHVASLFPFAESLRDRDRLVTTALLAPRGEWRTTLTLPALNAARETHFLVTGAGKAAAVRSVLQGALDPFRVPAQAIHAAGERTVWWMDRSSAAGLDSDFVPPLHPDPS